MIPVEAPTYEGALVRRRTAQLIDAADAAGPTAYVLDEDANDNLDDVPDTGR